jgi:HD-GYP domain-containing protein (c-di-GMP phosphodiesterase class II)
MLPLLVEKAIQVLQADAGALILLEEGALVFAAVRGPAEALLGLRHPLGDDPLWQVARIGEPMFIPDVTEQSELFSQWEVCRALMAGMTACACVPLKTAEATVGLLHLAYRSPRVVTEGESRLLTSIAEMAGNAFHRATLHEQTGRRLQHLVALHAVDMAISASFDLHLILNIFLDQVTVQLRVDAATVLLLNRHTQTLEYAAGHGFRSKAIERSRLRLGEGHAGRAALERRTVSISNLPESGAAFVRAGLLEGEGFIAYFGLPLTAKGQVKGVLEIFHRAPLPPDPEWLNFLETLAVQAAIAIDNAELFAGLQRSNLELALAYDTTLEGWSRALELRDEETEGHTRRVTEMTLRLARAMGITDAELVHVRRGAFLHDMGKMGVPDHILLKPGKLSDDEWAIMRKHPAYAYEMLSPIVYLRPALDIPYCHHEKWDGTGYPRGLKGEQIPLAARIFAVVDVWDALRSDRPYRRAWPEDQVREYIREQAGKHFDPQVLAIFLELER